MCEILFISLPTFFTSQYFYNYLKKNWYFDKIIENDFALEKIVLINKNRPSDDKLNILREPISQFPKKPIEFEVDFPEYLPKANYREIDLVFKHEYVIYLFKCKGTVDPLSEQKMYDKGVKILKKILRY